MANLMNDTIYAEVQSAMLNAAAKRQAGTVTQTQYDAAKADLEAYRDNMETNLERRGNCPDLAQWDYAGYPTTGASAGTIVPADTWDAGIGSGASLVDVSLNPPSGSGLTYNDLLPGSVNSCPGSGADPCVCNKLEGVAEAVHESRFSTMQTKLISRLDRVNGRLGAQKTKKLDMLRDILDNRSELYEFIIDLSKGLEPLSNPENALIDDVIAVYVDGPLAYGINGQPNAADSALKRTTILELNQTADPDVRGKLAERAQVCHLAACGHRMYTSMQATSSDVPAIPTSTLYVYCGSHHAGCALINCTVLQRQDI